MQPSEVLKALDVWDRAILVKARSEFSMGRWPLYDPVSMINRMEVREGRIYLVLGIEGTQLIMLRKKEQWGLSPAVAPGSYLLTSGKTHNWLSLSSLFIQSGTPVHEMVWSTDRAGLLSLTYNPDPHRHTQMYAHPVPSIAWSNQVDIQN